MVGRVVFPASSAIWICCPSVASQRDSLDGANVRAGVGCYAAAACGRTTCSQCDDTAGACGIEYVASLDRDSAIAIRSGTSFDHQAGAAGDIAGALS